jgi:hypothetical protein
MTVTGMDALHSEVTSFFSPMDRVGSFITSSLTSAIRSLTSSRTACSLDISPVGTDMGKDGVGFVGVVEVLHCHDVNRCNMMFRFIRHVVLTSEEDGGG